MLAAARQTVLRRFGLTLRRAGVTLCAAFAFSPAAAEILSARYDDPTTRYAHGVLGDSVEYGALILKVAGCDDCTFRKSLTLRFTLPETRVFEDLEPRLADVDNDGLPEVIVIESDMSLGASLAIYDDTGKIASTPYIGRTNRWLAPLGASDLDGDGKIELAYIDRPHLAKTLRIWRFENGKLTHVTDQPGLTNHRIGEDFISGGIRDCGDGPEIVTVNADWSRVMLTTLDSGRTRSRDAGPFKGQNSLKAALDCR